MEFFLLLSIVVPTIVIIRVILPKDKQDDEDDDFFELTQGPSNPKSLAPSQVILHGLPAAVTFTNLVIASRGNTPHTEIDEVIVSPFGIFCIELKSHQGLIFGSERQEHWTQCIGKQKYRMFNPLRQNYKHTEALKDLLASNLNAPIHSYVVFTHAFKVTVDSDNVFTSVDDLRKRIKNHTRRVYDLDAYERILKTLVYASTKSEGLMDKHIQEVQEYLKVKLTQD